MTISQGSVICANIYIVAFFIKWDENMAVGRKKIKKTDGMGRFRLRMITFAD